MGENSKGGDRMSSFNQLNFQKPVILLKLSFLLISLLVLAFLLAQLYLKKNIVAEVPEQELGKKVIVMLPTGKKVYTYENLIVSENGKLYYKGDRSTIDITGGFVKYDNWE